MLRGIALFVMPMLGSFKEWQQTTVRPARGPDLVAPIVKVSRVSACPSTIIDGAAAGDCSIVLASRCRCRSPEAKFERLT